MHLRLELFPRDLDAFHQFYTEVLRFEVERDDRAADWPYVAVRRGGVRIGAVRAWADVDPADRTIPRGVEIVLEVDDLDDERAAVLAAGWELQADIVEQPWGQRDFRLFDPDGHFLRITTA
jgi:predicted enzyme related to lactoylglutathione lyase